MNNKDLIERLKSLGFKKRWLSDKSGWWYSKVIKQGFKDIQMNEKQDTEWKLGISLKKSKAFWVILGMFLCIPLLIVLLLLRVI